jgi:hypothetical protein
MAEPPRSSGPDEDVSTPAWVYVGGILLVVAALAFVAMHLAGGVPSH